jgi:two-component system, sensor histidine kinase
VFTLELPLGRAVRADPSLATGRAPLGLTLDRRLVVMVEDDPAVRSGLEVLLKSWGASVVAFDGVASCRQWTTSADPVQQRPDLVIVDYRLEGGHNGTEAIDELRARFGQQVPAIMVTGSMMSHHEREAQDHDFHLLLKPVVPNKLRAMIAFKLGMR